MSQMNPKEVFHKTASSVQLPYIAGHSPISLQHRIAKILKLEN